MGVQRAGPQRGTDTDHSALREKICNDFRSDAQAHGLTRGGDARRIRSRTPLLRVARSEMTVELVIHAEKCYLLQSKDEVKAKYILVLFVPYAC